MSFNKNIYWNTKDVDGIANKWSWLVKFYFKDGYNSKGEKVSKFGTFEETILTKQIYSIGSMPTKELKLINSYQGGIRMTHPSRSYFTGDLDFEFYENTNFNITKIFHRLLDARFANVTIMDEDYPYKDSKEEIDKIVVAFFEVNNGSFFHNIVFHNCWVKEFEYLNNLETRNEEEPLKCKSVIKYNYYMIDEEF